MKYLTLTRLIIVTAARVYSSGEGSGVGVDKQPDDKHLFGCAPLKYSTGFLFEFHLQFWLIKLLGFN